MPVEAVVGACWGDEGKGKITDVLSRGADYVVRFQGGRNAGHTLVTPGGKFVLHMLPSGVLRPETVNVLGPGVALDLDAMFSELSELESRGVPTPRLVVSDRAQVVLPQHPLCDALEERRLGDARFGSTQSGIAPFYADKCSKIGVQVADLYDARRLHARLEAALLPRNLLLEQLYGQAPLELQTVLTRLLDLADRLQPYVADTTAMLGDALDAGRRIVVEGQLGALRDLDHGVYPYTTSSSPLAGSACAGAGIPPRAFERIVAVAKAYSTCVGAAPFVTELGDADGDELRERGGEFGATTGRPRRTGWFDAVATRYGCRVQGATEVCLTMLDVLGGWRKIPVCTAYEIDGETTRDFPATPRLESARPVYEVCEGWETDIGSVRRWTDLPAKARAYVEHVEALIRVPIRMVSVGPERDAVIPRAAPARFASGVRPAASRRA